MSNYFYLLKLTEKMKRFVISNDVSECQAKGVFCMADDLASVSKDIDKPECRQSINTRISRAQELLRSLPQNKESAELGRMLERLTRRLTAKSILTWTRL